jgi:hypothetical protein
MPAREHFRKHWFFDLIQMCAVAGILYWWKQLPTPGFAIGLLAVIAAVMSVHGEMRPWHKVVWMLLIGALLVVEFRAITKDRADFASAEAIRRHQENDSFKAIVDGLKASIAQSQEQFNATMEKTNQVLQNVTGGDAYAVLVPLVGVERLDHRVDLAIQNHGGYILNGVYVTLAKQGAYTPGTAYVIDNALRNRISVGTLQPRSSFRLAEPINPPDYMPHDDQYRLFVYIDTQNFKVVEYLDLRLNGNHWSYSYEVHRADKAETLLEKVDWSSDQTKPHVTFKRR